MEELMHLLHLLTNKLMIFSNLSLLPYVVAYWIIYYNFTVDELFRNTERYVLRICVGSLLHGKCLCQVLMCKDFVLIKGYPGTGNVWHHRRHAVFIIQHFYIVVEWEFYLAVQRIEEFLIV